MGLMEELQGNIEFSIPSYINKAIQPTFNWETAVGYLQVCADAQAGEPVGVLNYRLPLADQIDSIRPVFEYLNENLNVEVLGADMYITLTTLDDTTYTGSNDVIIWNVLGSGDLTLDGEDRYVEPGDLMYIPAKVEYTFKPIQARAYVLFSIKKEKANGSN